MPHLAFYGEERERWPLLCAESGRIGEAEVEEGIRRLGRHFNLALRHVEISFARGNRHSRAGYSRIKINLDYVHWLLIAHEFGHTYWYHKYHARRQHRAHGRQLARLINRFCEWIIVQGWHRGELAHEIALQELEQSERYEKRERFAAMPPPIDARIQHREKQIKRLKTRIKALSTRLKRASRSLAALQHSKLRQESQGRLR